VHGTRGLWCVCMLALLGAAPVLSRIDLADGLLLLARPVMGTRSHMHRRRCKGSFIEFGIDP
jgi:hypothetical protein